jgi:hypothetical protein
MTRRTRIRTAAALAAFLALAAGCGGGPAATGPVSLAGTWPEHTDDYRQVTERWTRRAVLRTATEQVLDVFATFKSPEWHAAHAAHLAETERLAPRARAERMARAREAAIQEPYELALLVTTHDRRENDLDKGARASWRLTLIDGQGNALEPVSVQRDRRPRGVIAAELPYLGDFAVPYVVRFPRDLALLGPDAQQIVLRMSSPRGAVELVWQNR